MEYIENKKTKKQEIMEMTDLTKAAYSLSKKSHSPQTDKGGIEFTY